MLNFLNRFYLEGFVRSFILAFLGATVFSNILFSDVQTDSREGIILGIHSYRIGYSWTERQIKGLTHVIGEDVAQSLLFNEFLDSKRIEAETDYSSFNDYVLKKYKDQKIAVIYATDDHALKCSERLRSRLGYEVPIVYSGITSLSKGYVPSTPVSTGVMESVDISEFVAFAVKLFPDTKKIYVLHEPSLSGVLVSQGVDNYLDMPGGVELCRLPHAPFDSLVEQVKDLPDDSIVLVESYRIDSTGRVLNQSEVVKALANSSLAPVFVGLVFSICPEMFGGYILDSYDFGTVAGEKIKLYMSGISIDKIPVSDVSPRKWVFSAKGLDEFGVKRSRLPLESEILFDEDKPMLHVVVLALIAVIFILAETVLVYRLLVSRRRLTKTTAELKQSQNDLKSWINHAPQPISIFNKSGNTIAINRQYSELFGYDMTDFKDADEMWQILIQDEFFRVQFLSVWKQFELGEIDKKLPEEITITTKSGAPVVTEIHVSVIGTALVCFYNDVTWRSQIEVDLENALNQAFNASKAKTQFLTNMSHEIRTPLNGVLGMTQLLSDTELDGEQRLFLETIQKSGEMLLITINDILDLSKIESGQLGLEHVPYDFKKCVRDSISISIPKLSSTVVFTSDIDERVPKNLVGDAFRVSQIIVNLLTNAFKYTREGQVELNVRVLSLSDHQVKIRLVVKDSGIGISLDKQKSIFEPFTQADTSNTRQYGGTGLGLTICRELASMMEGEISLKSSVGHGSEFSFTWESDIGQAQSLNILDQLKKAPSRDKTTYDVKTLVVEDNSVNYKVIELSLRKLGIKPVWAKNGKEAVSKVQNGDFELIFMDIQMPEMDGLTATRLIRQQISEDEQPFIIALTAHALADHIDQCRCVKMNGFLSKPFSNEDLKNGIELYLQEKKSNRAVSYF